MFACLPDIISNFGLTCTDTSERRNTLRFVSAAQARRRPPLRDSSFTSKSRLFAARDEGRGEWRGVSSPGSKDASFTWKEPSRNGRPALQAARKGMARGFVPRIERHIFRLKGAVPKWTPRAASGAEGSGGSGTQFDISASDMVNIDRFFGAQSQNAVGNRRQWLRQGRRKPCVGSCCDGDL